MIKICFVIFGRHDYKLNEAILEAVEFINKYIKIDYEITSFVTEIEPAYWEESNCYFAHSGDFKLFEPLIKDSFEIYVCLWKSKGKVVCWNGGTWGPEYGIKNAWLCSLPYDLSDCYHQVGEQWKYRISQRIVHELLNAFHGLGLTEGRWGEECDEYGFDDPELGWKECYRFILTGQRERDEKKLWLYEILRIFLRLRRRF